MKHIMVCILFLSVAFYAGAQTDTLGKNNIAKDSVAAKNIVAQKYIPPTSLNPYLFLYVDSLHPYKSKALVFSYRYMPGKYHNANIFNVTGSLLLGFIGYKTDHPYYYQPAH